MAGKQKQPADPPLFAFFNEIGILDQLTRSALEQVLPEGLTVPQFNVLNHFARLGRAQTPAALADAFQVSASTMTNTLKRLHERGLIEWMPDPADRRSKLVSITREGRRLREQGVAAAAHLAASYGDVLPVGRIERAIPLLREVRMALDVLRDDPDRMAANVKAARSRRPKRV